MTDLTLTVRIGDLSDGVDPQAVRKDVEIALRNLLVSGPLEEHVATVMVDVGDDSNLALWFTPEAIRDHYEADEDDPTEGLTDEQLLEIGHACLSSDILYSTFDDVLQLEMNEITNTNTTTNKEDFA